MRLRFSLVSILLLAACGDDGTPGANEVTGAAGSQIRVEPGHVEGLHIHGELVGPSEVAPVVEARGAAAVRVKRAIAVERQEGERWVPVAVRDLTLRPDCEHPASECITLVRGGGLRPPAWNGKSGDGQCACRTCSAAPAGVYRFVLESCEGDGHILGEPFSLTR